jgi:CRP-like cAMP-binding protein
MEAVHERASDLRRGQSRGEECMVSLAPAVESRAFFRPHQYLAREADAPKVVYRIDEGWACRFRLLNDGRRQITALFLPGDYCEPQWAFGSRPVQPIVALTNVRASCLPCPFSGGTPWEQQRPLWEALVATVERQADWLVTLGRRTAMERIAHLLCEIHARMNGSGLSYGQQCAMPLTQIDIADITGLTSVHVNRTLQMMRSAGLIELQSRWLRVPDIKALRQAANL